jgi:hypothetical protein
VTHFGFPVSYRLVIQNLKSQIQNSSQGSPALYSLGCNDDDGPPFYRHGAVLAILSAEKSHRRSMFLAAKYHFGFPCDQHVCQLPPIFRVAIDDEGDTRVRANVSHSLQLVWCHPFGLLIDGRVETLAVENETDGDDMRLAALIRGGKVRDAGGTYEA